MTLSSRFRINRVIVCLFIGICILFLYTLINKASSTPKVDLYTLLRVGINAAENGGKEVVKSRNTLTIRNKGLTKEGVSDDVTSADIASQCAIVKTLKHASPLLQGIISEESDVKCDSEMDLTYSSPEISSKLTVELVDNEDIKIWIDPLDATKEYTEKLYKYVTTMVCVAVKGEPIIGIIHSPFLNSTSWAWVGKATSANLVEEYQKNKDLNTKTITISRSHGGKLEDKLHTNLPDYGLIVAAGAGYKALLVATGKAKVYMHYTTIKKWDICAGHAIISALGGQMTTKSGLRIKYDNPDQYVNDDGLIATITNHDVFVDKF